ncbi:hypothetical protein [Mycobacterium sp. SA01]|uniref:hypothetical protein n=1 Tax=Mycobacterium sp. SA01 TaxID=3238820 RepID=UPI00351B2A05
MTTYTTGHIKRNPDDGTVAVRTVFSEDDPFTAGQAWLAATTSRGAHVFPTSVVQDWDDIYTPEPPAT